MCVIANPALTHFKKIDEKNISTYNDNVYGVYAYGLKGEYFLNVVTLVT